jgi:hypothetical protein
VFIVLEIEPTRDTCGKCKMLDRIHSECRILGKVVKGARRTECLEAEHEAARLLATEAPHV